MDKKVTWSQFCHLLEAVAAQQRKELKRRRIQVWFDEWRARDNDCYPFLRLLLPHLDSERATYNLKESSLANYIIEALAIAPDSQDAFQLKHWQRHIGKGEKDFVNIAYRILRDRTVSSTQMTLAEVNDQLDLIHSSPSQERKAIFKKLIMHLSAEDIKWILRVILKNLHVGISEKYILLILHPDAVDYLNVCSDLKKVCQDMNDPKRRFDLHEVALSVPFKPMLAERENPSQITTLMKGSTFFVERKIDGERIQLHYQKGTFTYYSRGGKDVSVLYGENSTTGSLSPYIHGLIESSAESFIFDGEMVAYDPDSKCQLPFGTLASAARNSGLFSSLSEKINASDDEKAESGPTDIQSHSQPCYIVFDCLYFNGKSLISTPLRERRGMFEKVVPNFLTGRLEVVPNEEISTPDDLQTAMEKALQMNHEGIIVKHPDSKYQPGKRINDWIKVKSDYIESLCDDLDVLVFGANFGVGIDPEHGSLRGENLTEFLCAIADNHDPETDPKTFLSFCKFGSGFNIAELRTLRASLLPHIQPLPKKGPLPPWLQLSPQGKERPDVIIEPSKSLIVQIKAFEVISSDSYRCGYTLRHPRFVRIRSREDRPWNSCMTLKELEKIRQTSGNKFQSGTLLQADFRPNKEGLSKKRKVPVKLELASGFKAAQLGEAIKESESIFLGKQFCVVAGDDTYDKPAIERLISMNGGEVLQNPLSTVSYIIAGKDQGLRVKNLMKSGTFDIIRPEWLLDCVREKQIVPLEDRHFIFKKHSED